VGEAAHRIGRVEFDEESLTAGSPEREDERRIAVRDLLGENYFEPEGAAGGPYTLRLGCVENRLELSLSGPEFERTHLLSLQPFRRIIKDYFMVCDSYYEAVRNASPQQIEALDMGRRGLHNEGSELLRERLSGKVKTDHETSRRLFTLLCALHWKGL
jgi:uncharacterized protein (UPF0262 family)